MNQLNDGMLEEGLRATEQVEEAEVFWTVFCLNNTLVAAL